MVTLLLVIRAGYAAPDTVKVAAPQTNATRSEQITKTRISLLDNFLAGNMGKVVQLNNYLIGTLTDRDYLALFAVEEWMIQYQTGQFRGVIVRALQFDSLYHAQRDQVFPQPDDLYKKLSERTTSQYPRIVNSIKNAALTDEERDFTILHFSALLKHQEVKEVTQDTLNRLADHFLFAYPASPLAHYVRVYIRQRYAPADWGFAFEFFSGYGFLTGHLHEHYTNTVPIGVDFDISYKNLVLYLRDFIGFSYTQHEFNTKSAKWPKHAQVRIFLPEASLGYIVYENKYIKVAPFVGIASTDIGPTDYDRKQTPDLKNYDLTFTTTYAAGINLDFKFGKPRSQLAKNGTKQSYFFLRLRYAYTSPMFEKYYPGFGGNIHYITVGFGMISRNIKRVY